MDDATVAKANARIKDILDRVEKEGNAIRGVYTAHEDILARYILYRAYVRSAMGPEVFLIMDKLADRMEIKCQRIEQAGLPC